MGYYTEIENLAMIFQETHDETVFNRIYMKLKTPFTSFTRRYYRGITAQDINLIVSNTLLDIWTKIDQFDPQKAKFTTWSFSILRNNALYHIKYRNKKHEYELIENIIHIDEDEEDDYETKMKLVEQIRNIVEMLDPLRKRCFEERYYEELSYQEMCNRHNIAIHTIKNNIHRALTDIRNYLKHGTFEPIKKPKQKDLNRIKKPRKPVTQITRQKLHNAILRRTPEQLKEIRKKMVETKRINRLKKL